MLIVIIGYLYVVGIVAIANMVNGKAGLGLVMLVFGAILPVWLWLWMLSRSRRAKRRLFEEERARREAGLSDSPGEAEHEAPPQT